MLVLDTNVLSELMLAVPEPTVLSWFRRQDQSRFFTTAVNVFELEYGIHRLPVGRRRDRFSSKLHQLLSTLLLGRVLQLDEQSAVVAAQIHAGRVNQGLNYEESDAMIAAIAMARTAVLVTRNTAHFSDLDLVLINPWSPAVPDAPA